ncbi:MAG: hypothetical protein IT244_11895 [Bacteroidia bacterium]|nr:hypothetical protein [Bacteroidia bacterium]
MYLQNFFKQNKNFGSSDRRFYRNACYSYWRTVTVHNNSVNPNTLAAALVERHIFESNATVQSELLEISKGAEPLHNSIIDTYAEAIDPNLNLQVLKEWFQQQAPIFLVANPGNQKKLLHALTQENISFEEVGHGVKIPANSNVQAMVDLGICRIQDLASGFSVHELPVKEKASIWDCCAGAGGKSLMLGQLYPNSKLYCSDNRENILNNLKSRFKISGMPTPQCAVVDLIKDEIPAEIPSVDVIVADVPCTGSGTWRHNPEEAVFFNIEKIGATAYNQRKIAIKAYERLKSGGLLVYITCSIFKAENAENAQWLCQELGMEMLDTGYTQNGFDDTDYIYRAVLQKK